MPELPEVETTRRAIEPILSGKTAVAIRVFNANLRLPIPKESLSKLVGERLLTVRRRAKYLLLEYQTGTAIIHLGMSGSLRVVKRSSDLHKHDHIEIDHGAARCLRLRDPRRFGMVIWTDKNPLKHRLLKHLGPEPLSENFTTEFLWKKSKGRKTPVKNFLMNGRIVVGIGNIYASEALFRASIHPRRCAGRISKKRYAELSRHIKILLQEAIARGGTTLKDFAKNDGEPGYFKQNLQVYGKSGYPCPKCKAPIRSEVIGQRSSFYCVKCQY